MTVCPKCGSDKVVGPRYCASCYAAAQLLDGLRSWGEHMHYICGVCGYEKTTACRPTPDRETSRG